MRTAFEFLLVMVLCLLAYLFFSGLFACATLEERKICFDDQKGTDCFECQKGETDQECLERYDRMAVDYD